MHRNTFFTDHADSSPNNEQEILQLMTKPRIEFIDKNYFLVIETLEASKRDIWVSSNYRFKSCFDHLYTEIFNFTNRVINGCNNEDITSLLRNIHIKLSYIGSGGASVGQCSEAREELEKLFGCLKLALEQGAVLAKEQAIHDAIKTMHPPTEDLARQKNNGCMIL